MPCPDVGHRSARVKFVVGPLIPFCLEVFLPHFSPDSETSRSAGAGSLQCRQTWCPHLLSVGSGPHPQREVPTPRRQTLDPDGASPTSTKKALGGGEGFFLLWSWASCVVLLSSIWKNVPVAQRACIHPSPPPNPFKLFLRKRLFLSPSCVPPQTEFLRGPDAFSNSHFSSSSPAWELRGHQPNLVVRGMCGEEPRAAALEVQCAAGRRERPPPKWP